MSIANIILATVVTFAPPCAGHWERVVAADGPWTFFAKIARDGPAIELRDEHGRLMAVQRGPSTTYWRCVPAAGGAIS